jgi:hypothetical protein
MNIFFDMSGLPASQSASLSFDFDDLDLADVNDPDGFFESISLSYWNWDGGTFDKLESLSGGTIKTARDPPPGDVPLKSEGGFFSCRPASRRIDKQLYGSN